MKNLFKYAAEHWKTLIVIIIVLFIQAYCDLSLPAYTSDIVNVGIKDQFLQALPHADDLLYPCNERRNASISASVFLFFDTKRAISCPLLSAMKLGMPMTPWSMQTCIHSSRSMYQK